MGVGGGLGGGVRGGGRGGGRGGVRGWGRGWVRRVGLGGGRCNAPRLSTLRLVLEMGLQNQISVAYTGRTGVVAYGPKHVCVCVF